MLGIPIYSSDGVKLRLKPEATIVYKNKSLNRVKFKHSVLGKFFVWIICYFDIRICFAFRTSNFSLSRLGCIALYQRRKRVCCFVEVNGLYGEL